MMTCCCGGIAFLGLGDRERSPYPSETDPGPAVDGNSAARDYEENLVAADQKWLGKRIRVTTVDPGMVLTDFSVTRFRGDRERADKVYAGMTPLAPDDVADAIAWALTRPEHVNVGEIVLWPTDQASTTQVARRS